MAGGFPPLVAALPAVSYPTSRHRCRAGYVSWAKTGPFLFPQKKENEPSYLIWAKAGPVFCILIRKEMGLDSFLQSIVVEHWGKQMQRRGRGGTERSSGWRDLRVWRPPVTVRACFYHREQCSLLCSFVWMISVTCRRLWSQKIPVISRFVSECNCRFVCTCVV